MKKKLLISIIYLLLIYFLFYLGCSKINFINYSNDLLFIFTVFNIFVLLHFFVKIKKLYNTLYKKRYLIGIAFLAILVMGKYNGSSIELWNNNVESSYQTNNSVILGIPRGIRSDEWLVSTPLLLSQTDDNINFSSNNNIIGATDNSVMLYPNFPSKDISIISTPQNIGYLFLDKERAFSLSWYFPYFLLFFASFELFMILTKKHKLYSLVGTILITLSPLIQWWQSPQIIAYGSLATVLFYYFINEKIWFKKLLLSILFGYSGYLYIMCLYPAWQVPYGYCYLIILIYILLQNKAKLYKKDLLYLIPTLAVIFIPIIIIFTSNANVLEIINSTVYPGARSSIGGGNWQLLFTYVSDIFYPFKKGMDNPCEFSQFISLYPIPLIYGLYIMFKNKKKDIFLILTSILTIVFSIWTMFPLGTLISKVTLLYMSTETRIQAAIGFLSILQLIYIISVYEKNIKEKIIQKKNILIIIISFIIICCTIYISNNVISATYPNYLNKYTSIISLVIFTIIMTLFIYNSKKTNYILSILLIFISIECGIIVSPINKGLNILYEKPIAKEIKTIATKEKDAIFAATDSGIVLSNYIAVNGAKTINTTHYLPDFDKASIIDPDSKYNDVYNRYHHLAISIVNEETSFVLDYPDSITLKLNTNDICKLNINYIVSNNPNEIYNNFNKIYGNYGTNIYKTNCDRK